MATALARQMMYRNSAAPHPLDAHRLVQMAHPALYPAKSARRKRVEQIEGKPEQQPQDA